MHNPNAATVAMAAEMLPRRPSQGLLRTQSVIMHVTTENRAIMMNVLVKYGTTVLVLASSSSSRVLEANLAVLMCLNAPPSSALPTTSRKASSQAAPLSFGKSKCRIKGRLFQLLGQFGTRQIAYFRLFF